MANSMTASMPQKVAKTLLCAIYTRKSTDENMDGNFTSLDSQAEYCSSYIRTREPEGWQDFPEVYSDAGFTGANMNRPGLQKMIADAKRGRFQIVICYKYDRLTRNTRDFLFIMDVFEQYGIHFVSVTQPIDTTSPVGRLMRSILMEFAQFEREMISERTRDKMSAMAKKGKWTGGPLPLGLDYDRENKKVVINKKEAEIARLIFKTYLIEQSLNTTAKILNEKGYRMKVWKTKEGHGIGGCKFFKTNLGHMLRNQLYIGKRVYKGVAYDAEHSGIIDPNVFERVQALMTQNAISRNSLNNDKHDFLLKGLVKCGSCGSAMIPNFAYSKDRKFFYYKCNLINRSDKSACDMVSVRAGALEQFVIDRLKVLGQDKNLVQDVVQEALKVTSDDLPAKRQEKTLVSAELGKVESEIKNWMDLLGEEGPRSSRKALILERLDRLGTEREDMKRKLIAYENEILELESRKVDADIFQQNLVSFVEVFEHLDPKQKKEFIRLLVKEVIFDRTQSRIRLGLIDFQSFEWSVNRFPLSFEASIKWLPG